MIVNHTYRFIFVHAPKCGGTALTVDLSGLTRFGDIELGGTRFGEDIQAPFSRRFGLKKHSTADRIREVVGHECWSRYFTFALVRNPFARTISTFRYLNRWRDWPGSEVMAGFGDVNEFVASEFWSQNGHDNILREQAYFTGQATSSAVKHVWKLEGYGQALTEITQTIGVVGYEPPDRSIPRNISPKDDFPPAALALTGDSVERIIRRYDIDFRVFGYPYAWRP